MEPCNCQVSYDLVEPRSCAVYFFVRFVHLVPDHGLVAEDLRESFHIFTTPAQVHFSVLSKARRHQVEGRFDAHVVHDLVGREILHPDRDADAAAAQLFRDVFELLVGDGLELRQTGRMAEFTRLFVTAGHNDSAFPNIGTILAKVARRIQMK